MNKYYILGSALLVLTGCTSTNKLRQQVKALKTENQALAAKNEALEEEIVQLQDDLPKPGSAASRGGAAPQAGNTLQATTVITNEKRTTLSFKEETTTVERVARSKSVEYLYEVKNTGAEPLVFKKVGFKSAALDITLPKEAIAPGAKGVVKLIVRPTKRPVNSVRCILEANTLPRQHTLRLNIIDK
jgi:outer membrane murein-binding lipoprotein Lpp